MTVYGLSNGAVRRWQVGFVLIYKATASQLARAIAVVGAYLFYTAFVLLRLPFAVAVLVGVAAAVVLGVAIERVILRPLVGEDPIAVIMVTIGLAAVLKAVVTMFFGTTPREMPKVLPAGTVTC